MNRIIEVKVVAGARSEHIENIDGGMLKVRVRTAPEKGKANARVRELIAEHLGVSKSKITLISGATGRIKRFLVSNQ